jgi:hypothetical protein|uniref:ZZ-type domain-containing protein n=1 Tax=viral metagenome TaxID=1070528 RepID=A0A6C0BFN3_9ZZZZ
MAFNTNNTNVFGQHLQHQNSFLSSGPTHHHSVLDNGQIVMCLTESKNVQLAILNELKQINETIKQQKTLAATPVVTGFQGLQGFQGFKPHNVIHTGVFCNVCGKHNITGVRYKCLFCKDFDMCEDCEAKTTLHDATHSFIKIKDTNAFNAKLNINTPLFNGLR